MQDIHIPVKWIAFWRRLRRLERGAVYDSGNGNFLFNPPTPKNRNEPCQFIVTDKSNLAGRNKGFHTWMGL